MQFYPDGDHYEGEWKYNKRNGKGIYYDKYGRRQEG